jgi:hypothetical protein
MQAFANATKSPRLGPGPEHEHKHEHAHPVSDEVHTVPRVGGQVGTQDWCDWNARHERHASTGESRMGRTLFAFSFSVFLFLFFFSKVS